MSLAYTLKIKLLSRNAPLNPALIKGTKANKTEKMAFKAAANAMKAIFSEGDFLSRKKFIKILSTYFIEKENSKGKIGFFLSMVKWRCEEADSHNSAQAPLT